MYLPACLGRAVRARARVDAPAGIVDLAPTVLSLLGKRTPRGLDGDTLAKAPGPEGKTRIYRVESKDSLQTLARAEVNGRFYLNFVKPEKA